MKGFFAVTLPVAAGAGSYLIYILADDYRTKRLLCMLGMEDDTMGFDFFTEMIKNTISNSAMLGTSSPIAAHYGSEDSALWRYDFILTALAHNCGLIFLLLLPPYFSFLQQRG